MIAEAGLVFAELEPAGCDMPFSLASSVTMGVISQKGRSVGVLPAV